MSITSLTSKGQATIPKDVRDYLGLHPGDKVDFVKNEKGHIELHPLQNITALKGMLHRPGMQAISVDEMHKAIASGAMESIK